MSSSNRIDPSPETSAATDESGASDAESRDPGDQLAAILLTEMAHFGVHEPGRMRRCEQDPRGGKVPVAKAQPVRLVDGAGERLDDRGPGQDCEGPAANVLREGLSLHELRRQVFGSVVPAGREEGDDVRVM